MKYWKIDYFSSAFVVLSGISHSRPLATIYSFFLYPCQVLICISITISLPYRLLSDEETLEIFGSSVSFGFITDALRQKSREKMSRQIDSPSWHLCTTEAWRTKNVMRWPGGGNHGYQLTMCLGSRGLPWHITAFGELALCRRFRGRIHSYLCGVTQGAMAACHRQLNWSREPCTGPWWKGRIRRVRRVTWRCQERWAFQVDERACVTMQKVWCKKGCCSSRGRTQWLGHKGVGGERSGGPDERDTGAEGGGAL